MNLGSRSCRTSSGKPNNLTTALKNNVATCSAESSPSPMKQGTTLTNPNIPFNASHDCILPPTQGQVGHEIDRPTPKTPGGWRDGLQESSGLLGAVLGALTHLTSLANLLAALPHVRPPNTCSQQSIHPPSPEVCGYLTAVGFVQQYLLTHPRHHQPCSFSLAPKHQF